MLPRNQAYPLAEIIHALLDALRAADFEPYGLDDFCLYGNDEASLRLDAHYWLADYPQVDDDDNEHYPASVQAQGLDYLYSGEQFADVLINAHGQKPTVNPEELVRALNHYSERDTFLDFE
ncbi:MAG: hypothetical protein GAK45_01576 [Pseudomonas citronellolis]|nr:MAG: hypothetical protein GAK45_01576 [Pseudomonas citronellolis]